MSVRLAAVFLLDFFFVACFLVDLLADLRFDPPRADCFFFARFPLARFPVARFLVALVALVAMWPPVVSPRDEFHHFLVARLRVV